jgi:hypothetical protein
MSSTGTSEYFVVVFSRAILSVTRWVTKPSGRMLIRSILIASEKVASGLSSG